MEELQPTDHVLQKSKNGFESRFPRVSIVPRSHFIFQDFQIPARKTMQSVLCRIHWKPLTNRFQYRFFGRRNFATETPSSSSSSSSVPDYLTEAMSLNPMAGPKPIPENTVQPGGPGDWFTKPSFYGPKDFLLSRDKLHDVENLPSWQGCYPGYGFLS